MKKKLLFLTPQLPYPPVSGGVIKSWKLIEFLSKKYDVFLAAFLKNNDTDHVLELKDKIVLYGSHLEPLDIQRTPLNLIKSNILRIPLNLYRNRSSSFTKSIHNALMFADIVFVDHYEMYQYVPKAFKGKAILHQHNCEYLMWERFAKLETNPVKRLVLNNQASLIRKYEKKICEHAKCILAAPNDIEELVKIGADPKKFYETFHLGNESLLLLPDLDFHKTEMSLFYCGTLTWEANIDGLLWFLEGAWKPLKKKFPKLKLYITGKHPDARILKAAEKAGKDVVITGFVEDLDEYFKKSRVFISPLRFGSGIKVKIMNALYRGIPSVTTSVGAEGLSVVNGEEIYIGDTINEMVEHISTLMTNEEIWNKFRLGSRAIANEKYTWDGVLHIVEKAIEA